MSGTNVATFQPLDGFAHVAQSIRDILTTRVGTRVLRRDYGSDVPNLLDKPLNAFTVVDAAMACADALDRWEPRFRLRFVAVDQGGPDGVFGLSIVGVDLTTNQRADVQVIL